MNAITMEKAMEAIRQTAEAAKADGGTPVALSVVDANGFVLAAGTMDGTPVRVIGIARAKAYTAAKMTVPTETFLKKLRDEGLEARWFCDDDFTPLPGGIPIRRDGVCVGAVGVSGRALDDDARLAAGFAERLTAALDG